VVLIRRAAFLLGALPLAALAGEVLVQGLGANPVERALHHTGFWGLQLLIATLAISPLRRWTGRPALIQARKALGLWAFAYLAGHAAIYVGLDQFFAWSFLLDDLRERPFIQVGMLSLLLLTPLALTSSRNAIRRMGRNWTRLHRLIYPATLLGLVHFHWGQKLTAWGPIAAAVVTLILLAERVLGPRVRAARPGKPTLRSEPSRAQRTPPRG
jgi:methionine sulfoxide reductase heme-binding subunit